MADEPVEGLCNPCHCLLSGGASCPLEKSEGFALVPLYFCDLSAYRVADQKEHFLCLPVFSATWTYDLRGDGMGTQQISLDRWDLPFRSIQTGVSHPRSGPRFSHKFQCFSRYQRLQFSVVRPPSLHNYLSSFA